MEGYCRAEGEGDRKKALSIWKYLSGQISHKNLGIDLPEKTACVSPSVVTVCLAIDACKLGLFEKEADEVWMYGQENEGIVLVSNVLTSYVECLSTYEEKGADRIVELKLSGMSGEECVRPNEKTIANAKRELIDHGWKKHANILDGLVIKSKKIIPDYGTSFIHLLKSSQFFIFDICSTDLFIILLVCNFYLLTE
jgi:hypothetical protein